MTVCEVGTNIGRVWRELSEVDKQRFNNEFLSDKVVMPLMWCGVVGCGVVVWCGVVWCGVV